MATKCLAQTTIIYKLTPYRPITDEILGQHRWCTKFKRYKDLTKKFSLMFWLLLKPEESSFAFLYLLTRASLFKYVMKFDRISAQPAITVSLL